MTMWRAALALLAVGCSNEAPQANAPPPRSPKGCLQATREVAEEIAKMPMGSVPRGVGKLACPELYSKADCSRAWVGLYVWRATPSGEDRLRQISEVNRVLTSCAVAYCGQLPAGARACARDAPPPTDYNDMVDQLIDLDRAILVAEKLDPASAETLSKRSILWRRVSAQTPAPADAGPAETELILTIAADGRTSLGGAAVEKAALPGALKAAAAKTRSIVIAADKRVPYKQVIDVIDQAKSAGFEQLAIKTEDAPP